MPKQSALPGLRDCMETQVTQGTHPMAGLSISHTRILDTAKRLAAKGNPGKACAHLREAMDKENPDPPFLLRVAQFLHEHGDSAGARQFTRDSLERQPFEPQALRLRCLLALEDGRPTAAAHDLAVLVALRSVPARFQTVAEAGLLRLQGRPNAARALLAPQLAQIPRDLDAWRADILCLLDLGQTAQATKQMEALRPEHPAAALVLAALAACPAPIAAKSSGGRQSMTSGTDLQAMAADDTTASSPETTRAILAEIIARRPDWARPCWALVSLELEQGNPKAALAVIDAAQAHVREDPLFFPAWARTLLALGRIDEAEALSDRQEAAWLGHQMRARIAATRGDRAAEAMALRAGLQRYPNNPQLMKQFIRSCFNALISPEAMTGWQGLFRPQDIDHVAQLEIESSLKRCDYERALALLRAPRLVLRGPLRARLIARALDGMNRDALALRYLRYTLQHWPSDKPLMNAYLRILLRRDRPFAGLKALDQMDYANRHGPVAAAEQKMHLYLRAGRLKPVLKSLDVLKRAGQQVPWGQLPFLLRAFLAEGDTAAAAHVARLITHDPRSTAEQTQNTLHGQILSEYRLIGALAAEAGDDTSGSVSCGAMTPVDIAAPDSVERLAALVVAEPTSNIAAMRLLRHWTHSDFNTHQNQADTGTTIPQQVFQYWDSPSPPAEIRRMIASWQRLPGHVHRLLDRCTAVARLRADFGPYWVKAFLRAAKVAEESDFMRLCLLARDGGIYADTDDMVTGKPGAVVKLIHGGAGLVIYTEPIGTAVGNNFIAAAPGHPAILLATRQARQALLMGANESSWSKTGPGLLSRAVALYIAREVQAGRAPDVTIIPRARLLRHVSFHNRLSYKATATHWANSSRNGEAAALDALLQDLLTRRRAA